MVNALRSLRDPDFGGGGLILCRVQRLGFRKGFVRASYYSIHRFYGLSCKQPGFYDETSLWVSPWVSVNLRVSGYFLRVLRSYEVAGSGLCVKAKGSPPAKNEIAEVKRIYAYSLHCSSSPVTQNLDYRSPPLKIG